MASYYKVTSRYAKALIDLAVERNDLQAIKSDADLIIGTCKAERDLILLFKNPIVLPQKKLSIFKKLFKEHISDLTFKFVEVIVRKDRSFLIFEIMEQFVTQYNTHEKIGFATLTTASEPSASIKDRVTKIVENATGINITLETKIESELIGGFQIRYQDRLIDASVSSKLRDLEKQITE